MISDIYSTVYPTDLYLHLCYGAVFCLALECLERSDVLADFVSLGQDQVSPAFRRQLGRGPAADPEDQRNLE